MLPVITSWTQGAWILLDILLVALLIYQVLVMIRGTRAVPMLVGLTVLAVIFYFARVGELTTLNWVVSRVLPYVVFALIVVFQSEIRHVLADLGRRLTFLGGSAAEGDSYDDIVLAVTSAVTVCESAVVDPVGPVTRCLGLIIPSEPSPLSARPLASPSTRAPPSLS